MEMQIFRCSQDLATTNSGVTPVACVLQALQVKSMHTEVYEQVFSNGEPMVKHAFSAGAAIWSGQVFYKDLWPQWRKCRAVLWILAWDFSRTNSASDFSPRFWLWGWIFLRMSGNWPEPLDPECCLMSPAALCCPPLSTGCPSGSSIHTSQPLTGQHHLILSVHIVLQKVWT